MQPIVFVSRRIIMQSVEERTGPGVLRKPWMPKRVLFTPDALKNDYGQELLENIRNLGLPVEILTQNRLNGLRGENERETYRLAKTTLAVVNAPPSQFRLQPIPPSADYQFHLAQGCPAHCQYCYLAGSLSGPPVIRVYANLPEILENLRNYLVPGKTVSFEASCYTDPLSLEHLTGGLAKTIRFFGELPGAHLRFVTKFASVGPLLDLPHHNHTRARISLNAFTIASRFEGGVSSLQQRIRALGELSAARPTGSSPYPIGIVLAPIIAFEGWEEQYRALLDEAAKTIAAEADLTFELITHRFTEGSKAVLEGWYPNSSLDMNTLNRSAKFNKFGGIKQVYDARTMALLKSFFYSEIPERFPAAKILYWT